MWQLTKRLGCGLCGAALVAAHHRSCGAASLNRPAIALCSDDPMGLDERNAPLCFHLLDPFLKDPFRAVLAEGRVVTRAVCILGLDGALVAPVTSLTTLGTSPFLFRRFYHDQIFDICSNGQDRECRWKPEL